MFRDVFARCARIWVEDETSSSPGMAVGGRVRFRFPLCPASTSLTIASKRKAWMPRTSSAKTASRFYLGMNAGLF